jgi:large subunit ribosomal protein L6
MSRIGNVEIQIPPGVKVTCTDGLVLVEGLKNKLSMKLPEMTAVEIDAGRIKVSCTSSAGQAKALHGLARSLINNMVIGVSKGYRKDLEIVGVGYRAQASGQKITLNLGYSHPVVYSVPDGVKVSVADNTKIAIEGPDKQLVGEVAATIRRFRKPEPYKGKGIRYAGEHITIKEGKKVGA